MKIIAFILVALLLSCSEKGKQTAENPKEPTTTKSVEKQIKTRESIILKLNPKVGQNYTFKVTIDQDIEQTFDTMKIKTFHNQVFIYSLQAINNNPAGGIEFDVVFRSIQQKLQTPAITIYANTDSNKKQNNPLETFYKSLIGKGFRIRVQQNGKNVELKGLDSLAQVVYRSLSKRKDLTEIELAGLKQITEEFFNPEEMKKNFEKTFEIYPDTAIEKNSKWTITKITKQPIPARIVNEYTLEKIIGDTTYLVLNSKIFFDKPPQSSNGQPYIKKMSGNQTGNLKIDNNSGMTIWGKFIQQIKVEYELPPSQPTNNKQMLIPMSIRTNFTYELIEGKN
ncbi:MAG: DUF6263 family protein [Candidatus Kapaibacteriales bacterium]